MNERRILARAERNAFRNALAHAKTRRGRLDGRTIHAEPSDDGRAARALYDALEPEPHWLKLWRRAYAKLPTTGKAVLRALETDWRTAPAARNARVSRPTVDHWKKLFKKFFAQCFRAWKRDFDRM